MDADTTAQNEEGDKGAKAYDSYSTTHVGFLQGLLVPYQQVAKTTVATMAPDDLTAPAHVCSIQTATHPLNLPYFSLKSSAQESQLTSFLSYAAYVLKTLMSPASQQASTRLCDLVNEDQSSSRLIEGSVPLLDTNEFLDGRLIQSVAFRCSTLCLLEHERRKKQLGVVAAGTQDGSLALWDLSSEVLGAPHRTCTLQPTYSTNYRIQENHTAPILRVNLEGNSSPKGVLSSGSLTTDLRGSFLELLSLDKLGFVHLRIVKEMQVKATRDDEPGLHPGGRHYLVQTWSIISVLPRTVRTLDIVLPEALTFATIPGRPQEILVGMRDGTLLMTCLVGSKLRAPRKFTRQTIGGSKPMAFQIICLFLSVLGGLFPGGICR
ncbi:hypothetical protein R1flu_018303 [Riccia fluitans]|uniref:Uncharacterized protein n=1 Tax=Riccia fluitans TaxID=41844 RepID=A0ABD1ZFF9_9MARC